ncbi:MAG: PIG-L family deacetylase [Chlorobi bacterium CHB2]|nr:PIG-L family deacetylase [Chlorobi bacterium CHB2]
MNRYKLALPFLLLALLFPIGLPAQTDTAVKVLLVNAHPDDESGCAATVYKITHDLKGVVDLAVITNGEAGYKYSTLAESIYGMELTEEAVGREFLPTIRKRELMNGGKWVGIRNYYFMEQKDTRYSTDPSEVMNTGVWNLAQVKQRLTEIILRERYDYIFCLLPTDGTHGHHKSATILALQTVQELPAEQRPVVLGVSDSTKGDTAATRFSMLAKYPETKVSSGKPSFFFDRTVKFGFKNALDYKIVVNWLIAEHKSQGTMQTGMNRGDIEQFWFFDINDPAKMEETKQLFERLKPIPFPKKEYK